jgi:8-oxo-dGTP pyrophosphatase MutT (NUDIX family)
MERIEITGVSFLGKLKKSRSACRGIILRDGELLMSYETRSGLWMIPGGGLEPGEDDRACCVREVGEETGFRVEAKDCLLEIVESFDEWKMINRYFSAGLVGTCERNLTEREVRGGMEPRWLPVREAMELFSRYADYDGVNELRSALYRRDWTALKAIFG